MRVCFFTDWNGLCDPANVLPLVQCARRAVQAVLVFQASAHAQPSRAEAADSSHLDSTDQSPSYLPVNR